VTPFYELLAEQFPQPEFLFMNYGYAEAGPPRRRRIAPGDAPYRHHLSLVRRVLYRVRLAGRDVLEIGSGRGGNCYYLRRYTRARRVVGLDLCEANLRRCRGPRFERIGFVCGDAARLPFPAASFDVVLNLESSHCYPDFAGFLAEVSRVLRPGGIFAYADFWELNVIPHDWRRRAAALAAIPLQPVFEEDISDGVFRALKSPDGLTAILRSLAREDNRDTIEWLAGANEAMRLSLAARQTTYKIWRFRKPHRRPAGGRGAWASTRAGRRSPEVSRDIRPEPSL
jgi:SAM-dependent methyltransferase